MQAGRTEASPLVLFKRDDLAMLGTDAGVISAEMIEGKTIGDGPDQALPDGSVRHDVAGPAATPTQNSVAVRILRTGPKPAAGRYLDAREESQGERGRGARQGE